MHALEERTKVNGDFLTRAELSAFRFGDGQTRRLIDASRGIWNPRHLAATLSIVSSPDGDYEDRQVRGGYVRYSYRAGSPEGDNTKLRKAKELGLPIIWLRKIEPRLYVRISPCM